MTSTSFLRCRGAPRSRLPTRIRLAVPQPTERQRIGNEINAAMIFAGADFINVLRASHRDRSYHFGVAVWRAKEAESVAANYWEIIADNLSKAGWSWGCVSAINSDGKTIFVADAHRDDRKRFVVRADGKLTAFLELERVTHNDSN